VEWALRWGVGFVGGGLSSLLLHLLNLFLVRPLNSLEGGRSYRNFRSTVAPKGQSIAIGGSVRDSRGFRGRDRQHRTGLHGAPSAWITLERGRARKKCLHNLLQASIRSCRHPWFSARSSTTDEYLLLRSRAAVLRAKAPDFLHILPRTSPYEFASALKRVMLGGRVGASSSRNTIMHTCVLRIV
jgi:hypothetical protein